MKSVMKFITAVAVIYAFIFVMMLANVFMANVLLSSPK